MIVISKETYYIGVWFVPFLTQDWLCVAYRGPDGKFVGEYRYRRYASGAPHDVADAREWFKVMFEPGEDEAYVIRTFDDVVAALQRAGATMPGDGPQRLLVKGDGEALRGLLAGASFAHYARVERAPEARADLLS